MRLFLLPISTRRTLLYCQRAQGIPLQNQGYVERYTAKAAKLWADWEKKENGWQKKVVDYGNHALRRIPFEEWGLKSVPPLSTRRREEESLGKNKAQLVFPGSVIPSTHAVGLLRTLGTERETLHRNRLMWCFVGMPISAPFMIVPIIPNLPFYYLVYRAWSHWRALAGGKHLKFLTSSDDLLSVSPSPALDSIYAKLLSQAPSLAEKLGSKSLQDETMLLSQENRKQLANELDIPELETELERAIWQVENAIRKEKEKKSKKED